MTWNYRVFLLPSASALEEDLYVIKEVYYNEDDEIEFWSEGNMTPMGNSVEDLEEEMNKFYEAFSEPVLMVEGDMVVEVGDIEYDDDFNEPIIDVDLDHYH
jgi:hypothetical protein